MTFSERVFAQSLINCSGDEFDPKGYLAVNPDVESAGADACAHYTSHGKKEGRSPNPKNLVGQNVGSSGGNDGLINCSGDQFDPEGYLLVNPDLEAAGVDACAHYTSHGKKEGRSPNPKNRGGQTPGPSLVGPRILQ